MTAWVGRQPDEVRHLFVRELPWSGKNTAAVLEELARTEHGLTGVRVRQALWRLRFEAGLLKL